MMKVLADERWDRRLTENFQENKKSIGRRSTGCKKGICGKEKKVKPEDVKMLI